MMTTSALSRQERAKSGNKRLISAVRAASFSTGPLLCKSAMTLFPFPRFAARLHKEKRQEAKIKSVGSRQRNEG
jgi:hypothetical protein